jgi:hypothetical protein
MASLALAFGLGAGGAYAIPADTLPGGMSYESVGLNGADNSRSSTTVGELDYTGHPGCGGVCTATTTLGADPGESISMDEVLYKGGGGGYTTAEIGYYFKVLGTGTTTIHLHAADSLVSLGGSSAQTYLLIGLAGNNPTNFYNFTNAGYIYQDTDCANRCSSGVANYTAPSPLAADKVLVIARGMTYFVDEALYLYANNSGIQTTVSADPTFSTAPGDTIEFSPGVTSAVPEPAAWTMMLFGVAVLGAATRARRKALA